MLVNHRGVGEFGLPIKIAGVAVGPLCTSNPSPNLFLVLYSLPFSLRKYNITS